MENIHDIISRNCTKFLEAVKMFADSNQNRPQLRRNGGFPILYSENQTYHDQSYLEERIENFTWFYLINSILRELFDNGYGIEGTEVSWPNIDRQMASSFVNTIEKNFPVEFYIKNASERVGYRYTDCIYSKSTLDKILEAHKIDRIIIIDFSSEHVSAFLFPQAFPQLYANKISLISFEQFIKTHFKIDVFNFYFDSIKKTIAEAYSYIGIESVTNLTVNHLPYFIDKILEELSEIDYSSMQYRLMGNISELKKYQQDNLNSQNNKISPDDYSIMNNRYLVNERYLALAGKADFARSFITSEYLYNTLSGNNVFDYTAIVSGYLKSIEQLLDMLMEFKLSNLKNGEKLFIKKNSKSVPKSKKSEIKYDMKGRETKPHIEFKPENKKYFDTTFSPLVNFLNDDLHGWNISEGARILVTTYLSIYCDECRNEHFHKDNIDSISEVETIRFNTLLLFYYVLGGYNLFDDINSDYELLQIADRKFDKMYRAIYQKSVGVFYRICFDSGDSYLVALPSNQKENKYDKYGILEDKLIRFVKVKKVVQGEDLIALWNKIENDYDSEDVIYVTQKNRPTHIFSINTISEEETEILW